MDDVGRVHIVATCQHLEHKVLQVIVRQVLPRVNDTVHVRLHQLSDDVDVFVTGGGRWLSNVDDLDDVLMVKEFEQLDLAHDSLGINQILEGFGHFLDGDFAVSYVIVGTADDTVCTMTDLLNVLELLINAEGGTCNKQKEKSGILERYGERM